MHSSTRPRSGAALLIAVAILFILTVFAIVFSIQSSVDMKQATNFSNSVRADLMADAGVAIAIAFLDHDRDVHPTVTALDHAWRTYFDGTWIAGKQWAFNGPFTVIDLPTWIDGPSVLPVVGADEADVLGDSLYIPRFADRDSPLFQDLQQPFLIFDPDSSPGNNRTRAEQLHQLGPNVNVLFTDVDNDGDGFRDSMWIPIPADSIFGGIDLDRDGETDGIDNDLDGLIDEAGETNVSVDEGGDGIDNDLDGEIDEAGELALFVYWGGNDDRDNDRDGNIDELDEQKIFLTAPLAVTDQDDIDDFGKDLLADGFEVRVNLPVLLDYADASAPSEFVALWQTIEYAVDIDVLDNDFDFIVNNDDGETFVLPFDADDDGDIDLDDQILLDLDRDGDVDDFDIEIAARQLGRSLINTDVGVYDLNPGILVDITGVDRERIHVAAKGEPVCFIAGRVAILITDESSKVNIDAAGAHMPNEHFNTLERRSQDSRRPIRRALSQGIGPHEYDLRVLPDIGEALSGRMWDYRMGISNGLGFRAAIQPQGNKFPSSAFPEYLDISMPGYGGVDDNMSSLWMAVNGIDDDGDAEIYQNDGIDNNLNRDFMAVNGIDDDLDGFIDEDSAPVGNLLPEGVDEPGEGAMVGIDEGLRRWDYDGDSIFDETSLTYTFIDVEFANFEGVDEPGEFQLYRPLRNRVLEETIGDEDEDELFEEFGEASDRVYHARDQLRDINGIGPVTYESIRNLVTAHSLDGGGRYQYFSRQDGSPLAIPLLSGLKLNLNYAMAVNPNNAHDPGQIARMFMDDHYYPPSTEDAQFVDPFLPLSTPVEDRITDIRRQVIAGTLTETQRLFLAGMRQEDAFLRGVPFFDSVLPGAIATAGPMPPDQELRALRLSATLQDFRDRDHVRTESSLALDDLWYTKVFLEPVLNPFADQSSRQIEYKMSGVESIRINEIMVRPVRRIEAEATTFDRPLFFDADVEDSFGDTSDRDPNDRLSPAGDPDFDITVENYETGSPFMTAAGIGVAPAASSGWRLQGLLPRVNGENEAFATDRPTLTDGSNRFDIIQFRFRPGPGLPPGRYYMTINFSDANGVVNQNLDETHIAYAVKYVVNNPGAPTPILWPGDAAAGRQDLGIGAQKTADNTDILLDHHRFNDDPGSNPPVPWKPIAGSPAVFGQRRALAGINPLLNTGWIFLATNDTPGPTRFGYEQDGAFTVEIPPFQDPTPFDPPFNVEQVELCVAIRFTNPSGLVPTLSLNFFDFSQDPDHEYIEIVNIEEPPANLSPDNVDVYAIDLSGWQIEVGDSNTDSNAVVMTIPDGTQIAPGDSLLLAVNKFDGGIDGNGRTLFADGRLDSVSDIFKNGIGLARGPRDATGADTDNAFGWVTEPSIPRIDATASANAGSNVPLNYTPAFDGTTPTGAITGGSIFFRPVDREMVDADGNGVDDFDLGTAAEPLANVSLSTPESEPAFGTFQPTAFAVAQNSGNPAKAWDRIVQLEIANDDITFFSESPVLIGELVLRGGVFPNYPELDGVDNDGDNGFLENDDIDNDGDYDPSGVIDVDGDGRISNDIEDSPAVNGLDDDNDGFIDEDAFEDIENIDENFEGVDEGYVRRYKTPFAPVAGSYDDDPVLFTQLIDAFGGQPVYLANVDQSPDWKAFVERRFYPGDNVIVTLYDGPVGGGRVVDRVTYNQRDVENVAIIDGNDDIGITAPPALQYNALLPEAWPRNTMGLDFYRSLERKHPLYAGDRFGTRNRWTATDGNYDDWSRGTNRFDQLIVGAAPEYLNTDQTDPLFAHGLSGSPLRMNFYQRVLENAGGQFNAAESVNPTGSLDTQWMFDRAKVRNRNLASVGDVMTLSHMSFIHSLYEFGGFFDPAFEATPFRNPDPALGNIDLALLNGANLNGANPAVAGPLIGMDFPKDLLALMTSTSMDELNLSVGQADFYPLYPTFDQAVIDNDLVRWTPDAFTTGALPPRSWSPVFLYPLGLVETQGFLDGNEITFTPNPLTDGIEAAFSHLNDPDAPVSGQYPFLNAYLFQPSFDPDRFDPGDPQKDFRDIGKIPAGTSSADMFDRWPIDRRAVAYVAANPASFDPNSEVRPDINEPIPTTLPGQNLRPAEALFVWQGEDGLQNGRYDAYIITMDNLDDVAYAHIESAESLLTAVGQEVVGAMRGFTGLTGNNFGNFQRPNPEDFTIDAAFFTDFNGDRRCWTDDPTNPDGHPGLPDLAVGAFPSELNFEGNNLESFGLLPGLVPTRDGIIHYGAVEVKNNYLALWIRNWAANTATNRITRVVLTPRRAASGRINVNTAVTRLTDNGELFNPLMGIPGLLASETNASIFPDNDEPIDLPNGYGDTAADGFVLLDRSDEILGLRQDRGVDTEPYLYPAGERVIPTPFTLLGSRNMSSFFTALELEYPQSLFSGTVPDTVPTLAITQPVGEARFNEIQARMSLLANFITTRSDVFEIIVTAQPGYVADNNGDGVLNWRDDNEFVPTGEIKRRIIYERSQGDPDDARL